MCELSCDNVVECLDARNVVYSDVIVCDSGVDGFWWCFGGVYKYIIGFS